MSYFTLAIDPGSMTGVCGRDSDGHVTHEEVAHTQMAELALSWVEFPITRPDVLVVESFIIHPGTVKKSRDGIRHAIELIGVLRHVAHQLDIDIYFQTPSQGKRITNDMLKEAGLYVKSLGHARDAARHMYLYLAKKGQL